jgi:hypothetical protein
MHLYLHYYTFDFPTNFPNENVVMYSETLNVIVTPSREFPSKPDRDVNIIFIRVFCILW